MSMLFMNFDRYFTLADYFGIDYHGITRFFPIFIKTNMRIPIIHKTKSVQTKVASINKANTFRTTISVILYKLFLVKEVRKDYYAKLREEI